MIAAMGEVVLKCSDAAEVTELQTDALGEGLGGGRFVPRFDGDELPHAGPAAARGALFDEPLILIGNGQGPAALDGADFASGWRWNLIDNVRG